MNNILVNIRKTLLPREKSTNKAVLVTGCDSGFGAKIADHLTDLGFHVFAGCLSREKAVASHPPCFNRDFLQMNVTSESEIKEAMDVIRKRLQETGTGLGTFGEVEWVPISAYQRLMDVNVWGTIRVTQASLPLIRKTRGTFYLPFILKSRGEFYLPFILKSRGRVINVSSMLGRMGYPIRSPYCISKFSVEALSDCLRYEMKRWGVKVVVVEPGNYIAGMHRKSESAVRTLDFKVRVRTGLPDF
ncbi:unnamed protein product [Cyprideis torosa]|uniref:Uncharacterized protein n=1 Tax=Cyprideis torosa TaxID=163714 RepID=A0A7R8WIS8_9CRUS|nr:unnamed protein product [Cyprideis torosa]CAG0901138.1 unnamed protein product [Cyprideis torosa]